MSIENGNFLKHPCEIGSNSDQRRIDWFMQNVVRFQCENLLKFGRNVKLSYFSDFYSFYNHPNELFCKYIMEHGQRNVREGNYRNNVIWFVSSRQMSNVKKIDVVHSNSYIIGTEFRCKRGLFIIRLNDTCVMLLISLHSNYSFCWKENIIGLCFVLQQILCFFFVDFVDIFVFKKLFCLNMWNGCS